MTSPKLFLLYTPVDAVWAQSLYQQLHDAGYNLYMEPPESDPEDAVVQRKTTAALQKATHLLAVVSKESALGESAPVFEAWWRPFLRTGRPVIACVVPDAPPGAEHWMPFDLLRQRRADFRETDGLAQLQKWIGPVPTEGGAISEPLTSRANPESRASRPEPAPRQISSTPRPPQPKTKDIDEPLPPLPERAKPSFVRSIINTIGVGIGLVVMVVLLFAASQAVNSDSGVSAETWLASLLILVLAVALIGRITTRRRQRHWRIEYRRQKAQAQAKMQADEPTSSNAKPEVYLEVIQSKAKQDIGQIWAIDDFALTVGRGSRVDVPLRDKDIAKRQCVVFFDDGEGRFYLENLDAHERTVFYDKPLLRGEVVPIENGDMIRLGKSAVLQFRLL